MSKVHRRCHSTSYNNAVAGLATPMSRDPTTPTSCDGATGATLLSLPAFHSDTLYSGNLPLLGSCTGGYRTDDPGMSTSLLDHRNESWSSFSSLHSLPEPFLQHDDHSPSCRGIPDAFRVRAIPPKYSLLGITTNGWQDGLGMDRGGNFINGYASEADPGMHSVFHRPSGDPTNYSSSRSNDSGTLRASSVGREIDSEVQLNSGKAPAATGTIRSSSAHHRGSNSVIGHLMRAKSATSKTLRKIGGGPKFSSSVGSTKLVPSNEEKISSSDVKNAIVRRSSSIAQRFRSLRQPMGEPQPGAAGVGGKLGPPLMLRRARERSPLAFETPREHTEYITPSGHTQNSEKSQIGRDQPRRVLFGASTLLKDDSQKVPGKSLRQSFHGGRERTASCGDAVTFGSADATEAWIRPRSTEPLSKSVRIEPTSYLIQSSNPIDTESTRSNSSVPLQRIGLKSSPPRGQFYYHRAVSRSPRIASPESSSLSSGSPASVFSGLAPSSEFSTLAPPTDSFWRTNASAAVVPSDSLPSVSSDLWLWEMPRLDHIDLMDSVFVGPQNCRSGSASDFVPLIMNQNPSYNGLTDNNTNSTSNQTDAVPRRTRNCNSVEYFGNVSGTGSETSGAAYNCIKEPSRNFSGTTSTHNCSAEVVSNVSTRVISNADCCSRLSSTAEKSAVMNSKVGSSTLENVSLNNSINSELSPQVFPSDTVAQHSSNSVSDDGRLAAVSVVIDKDLNLSEDSLSQVVKHSEASRVS